MLALALFNRLDRPFYPIARVIDHGCGLRVARRRLDAVQYTEKLLEMAIWLFVQIYILGDLVGAFYKRRQDLRAQRQPQPNKAGWRNKCEHILFVKEGSIEVRKCGCLQTVGCLQAEIIR
ncbi:hypothetical protein ABIA45_005066 [Bradyrhizobium sp. USDA 336]